MKKFAMQVLEFDASVGMPAICYSALISTVPINEQLYLGVTKFF